MVGAGVGVVGAGAGVGVVGAGVGVVGAGVGGGWGWGGGGCVVMKENTRNNLFFSELFMFKIYKSW